MINWNPFKQNVVYLHLGIGHGGETYIKADAVNYRCWVIHLDVVRPSGFAKTWRKGFFELKWQTFIGNYTHWLEYNGANSHLHRRKPGNVWKESKGQDWRSDMSGGRIDYKLKYTTENQFNKALQRLAGQMVGPIKKEPNKPCYPCQL